MFKHLIEQFVGRAGPLGPPQTVKEVVRFGAPSGRALPWISSSICGDLH
jgi:hypothetical protein